MANIKIDRDIELEHYLELVFKERFNSDFTSSLDNHVHGSLDGERIVITFWPHDSIVVSAKEGSTLDKLVPVLTEVMDNIGPMCKYKTVDYGQSEPDLTFMEWDIKDPDKRLKELINDRGYEDGTTLVDFELLNGKQMTDYLDTEEEKREIMKNARIYGIDKGCLKDPEVVNNLNAADLYLTIETLYGIIMRARRINSLPFVKEKVDLTEELYGLDYLLYQTKKFGVEVSEPKYPRHIIVGESFQKWFQFYKNHFDQFTDEQWEAFNELKTRGGNVTEFMPVGDWRDSQEEKPTERTMKPGEDKKEEE